MADDIVEFHPQCKGWSAGINSAEFFTCSLCGACVIEMHGTDTQRYVHRIWHEEARRG